MTIRRRMQGSPAPGGEPATQLSRLHWIELGLHLLGQRGLEAVRVEVLARRLHVTKGSFYWHFKNRQDLFDSMVELWEEETRALLAEAGEAEPGLARLNRLFELVDRHKGRRPDVAIFSWARRDTKVAARVEAVERKRIEFLEKAFREVGGTEAGAREDALFTYLAFVGWLDRSSRAPKSTPAYREFAGTILQKLVPGHGVGAPSRAAASEAPVPPRPRGRRKTSG